MAKPLDKSQAPTLTGTMTTPAQPAAPASIEQLPPELLNIAAQGGLTPEDIGVGQTVYGGLGYGMGQSMAPLIAAALGAQNALASAETEYSTAQRTPAAQTSPYADLLKSVMGNLSSVLQGSREPFKQAMEGIKSERAALENQRVETLKRLSQVVDERSKAAREAGNAAAEEKSLQQKDRIEKTLEAMLKNKADREEAERRARENAARAAGEKDDKARTQLINQATIRWSKPSNDMETILDFRNQIMQTSNDGPGDLLMIRFLARISDPRTGVREEEFKTFKSAEGWVKRTFNAPRSWFGQGMLTDEGRLQLRAEAEKMFRQKLASFDSRMDSVRAMYIRQGMAPEDAATAIYDVVDAYRLGLEPTAAALGLSGQVYSGARAASPAAEAPPKKPGATREQLAGLKTKPVKPKGAAADTTRTRKP